MKNHFAALLACAAISVCSLDGGRAQDLPTVFVAPFSGDTTAMSYWQPAMGEGLCEMLITELGKINKFTVLETSQLGALKDEIKMGDDGWVEQGEKVDKSGFSAADFMFTAKVTRFGSKETKVGLGGFVPGNLGNVGVRQAMADVRIDWRLVDAANRRILKTGSSTAQQKGTGFDVGVNVNGSGGAIGFNNQEFVDSALGKATVKALDHITADLSAFNVPESGRHKQKAAMAGKEAANATAVVEALKQTPGKVLAVVNNETIIISLGSKHGLKAGDKLVLLESTEIKDGTGAVVFSEDKPAGEVSVVSTQDDRSKVSYSGDKEVKPGWTVKVK